MPAATDKPETKAKAPATEIPSAPIEGKTPPPATEGAAAKPAKPKELTSAQLEGAKAFLSREFPSVKFSPPKKDDAPADKKDADKESEDDEGDKPAKKKPAAKPGTAATTPPAKAKKPAVPPAQPPAPALTPEQIAEAAARGAAKGLSEAKTETAKKQEKAAEESLTPSDRRKVEVLRHLEKTNPDRYKGIAEKFITSSAKLQEYASKWEKDHPGEDFDEQSPEHEDFFAKNDVDWDEDDFTDAAVDMRVQKALEGKTSKTTEEIETLKRKVELQESTAEIGAKQTSAAVLYWSGLGDEFKDIVTPDGAVNSVKLAELQKTDPEGTATRINAARALNTEVAEIHKVYRGLATFQPETNPVHKMIQAFGAEMETKMLAGPEEDRIDGQGRPFVTAAQYNRLTESQRQHYWTFSAEDLIEMRSAELAKLVNRSVQAAEEAHRRWAKSRGIELPEPATPSPAAAAGNGTATPEPDDDEQPPARPHVEKPISPSSMPETRGAAARGSRTAATPRTGLVSKLL